MENVKLDYDFGGKGEYSLALKHILLKLKSGRLSGMKAEIILNNLEFEIEKWLKDKNAVDKC
jgi:hypothetical protein